MPFPSPRPAFSSERLLLEPVTRAHAPPMLEVLGDPRIFQFLDGNPPELEFLERRYRLLESGLSPDGSEAWLTWICFIKQPRAPIGFIQATVRSTDASFAYVFHPDFWRQGYAREAVSAMLDVVFQQYGIHGAQIEMDTRNQASMALAESLGFTRIRTICGGGSIRGEAGDEHEYVFSREAWINQRER